MKVVVLALVMFCTVLSAAAVRAQSVQIDPDAINCTDKPCIRAEPSGRSCPGGIRTAKKPTLLCGVSVRPLTIPRVGTMGIPSYKLGEFHIYRTREPLTGTCVEGSIFRGCR